MKRAEFLKVLGAGTLTAIAGSLMSACKSATPTTPETPDTHVFTSSSVNDHTHTITLNKTELQSPPSGGISRETSSTNGHTHTFTMSASELSQAHNGSAMTIATAETNSHHHSFTIQSWYW
jgi:hypothetical protein